MPPVLIDIQAVQTATAVFKQIDDAAIRTGQTITTAFTQITPAQARVDQGNAALVPGLTRVGQEAARTSSVLVDAFGRPIVTQGQLVKQTNEVTTSLQKTTTEATKTSQSLTQGSVASTLFGGSLRSGLTSALAFGAGVGGVYLGVQALGSGVRSAVTSLSAFESAQANVNTLLIGSVNTQERLRTELLRLPPALGAATDLSRGLYEVLSSGIAPTKAVEFLATAAQLAQAGLAQLDTSTIALTKTMAAYNLPAEQAGRVSDILFKTVEIGQGSLQAFAGALPQVTQLSASMGVSLEDTANALATLSQTFRNADTAATGYRSLLQQLIQNSDKFLALGINIRQVISEQGLLGAVKILQQVSQGSSERLRIFVNDIEGFNAALALTGPQFQTLVANQEKFKNSTGVVASAVRIQTETMGKAWDTFANTVDRSLQNVGPVVTTFFTGVLQGATNFVASFNTQVLAIPKATQQAKQDLDKIAPEFAATVRQLLSVPTGTQPAEKATADFHAQLLLLPKSAQPAAQGVGVFNTQAERATTLLNAALIPLTTWRDETTRSAAVLGVTEQGLKVANTALLAFDAALKEVKGSQALTTGQVEVFARTLETSLKTAASSGLVATSTLQKGATEAADAIRDRLGQLTPGLRGVVTEIENIGKAAPPGLEPVTRTLKVIDDQGKITLKTIQAFGPEGQRAFAAAESAIPKVTQVIKEVDDQGKITLKTIEVFGPATEKAFSDRAVKAIKTLNPALKEAADALALTLAKFGADSVQALATLTTAEIQVKFELGEISRQARDTALQLKKTGEEGGRDLGDGIKAGAEKSIDALRTVFTESQKLDVQLATINLGTKFASDLPTIIEQLERYKASLGEIGKLAPPYGFTPEEAKNQRDVTNKAITELTDRLRGAFLSGIEEAKNLSVTLGKVTIPQALIEAASLLGGNIQTITTQIQDAINASRLGTTQLTTATEGLTQATERSSSSVSSLSSAYLGAASSADLLLARQRELLLLGSGSQITDAPGRLTPVGGALGGNLGGSGSSSPGAQPGLPGASGTSSPLPFVGRPDERQALRADAQRKLAQVERQLLLSRNPQDLARLEREREALLLKLRTLGASVQGIASPLVTAAPVYGSAPQQSFSASRPGAGTGGGSSSSGGTLQGPSAAGGGSFTPTTFTPTTFTPITFAQGGLVPGNGPPDSVAARLSPGEVVLRSQDVGEAFRLIRRGRAAEQTPGVSQGQTVINNVTVHLTLQLTTAMSRSTAQEIVTELTPALQLAINRQLLTMKAR